MKMLGAEAVVKGLEMEEVEIVFGYPGAAIMHVYDALRASKIHHVLVRNEQGAAHAANGYARVTGKVGVCISTSGPGATNLITGIATAYMDSIPIVAITGQVPLSMIGRDVFQEVDITGAVEPFTKYSYLVKDAADIPRIIKEAFYIASSGRPGPVLIDLPKDVASTVIDYKEPEPVCIRSYKPTYIGHPGQIKRLVRAIRESKRPVICVGGGCISSNAAPEVMELAERIKAPVASTLMGIGAFPATNKLYLGMLGQHGIYAANRAVKESDLVIVLGARMGDRAVGKPDKFAKEATIVHIDIDPAEIGKNVGTNIPIVGDVKLTLKEVLKKNIDRNDWGWLSTVEKWKKVYQGVGECSNGLNPMEVLKALSTQAPKDAILVTDVGQHQIWAGRYYPIEKPRTFITSGGLGTMGYGLSAAIGAKLGQPDKQVLLITGDGSFQMNIEELATMVQEKAAVKILLFNNRSLGMVRELQQHQLGERYYQTIMEYNPDFIKLAEAYGIEAFKVKERKDIAQAIKRVLESKRSIIAEFSIDSMANVIPVTRGDKDEAHIRSIG